MHPEVAKLLDLQKIDARLEVLLKEAKRRPQVLANKGGELGEMQERRDELATLRKEKQVEIDRIQLDVKSYEEKINDSQQKLSAVSNQSEYQGLQKQMERFESEKSKVEESLIGKYDEFELIKKAEKELLASMGIAEEDLVEDQGEFEKELEEIRAEATELVAKREAVVAELDEENVDMYDRLFSRYQERSVVGAHGGVCSGCHLAVSPQTINRLKSEREIVLCDSCSRVLFL